MSIQLFRERLSEKICMWQSQKVIWGNYDQYTVPDTVLTFCCFRLAIANISPLPLVPFLQIIIFEEQWAQNHPQYLSGLLRVLFLTTFLEIAVHVVKLLKQSGRQFWDSLFALKWRCLFICWTQVLLYLFNIHMSLYLLCYNITVNWLQLLYTVHLW